LKNVEYVSKEIESDMALTYYT